MRKVKANQLVQGTGPWLTLGHGDRVRKRIYRSFMRLQEKTRAVRTFAVVVDKGSFASPDDVRRRAWQNTLERVERFATKSSERVMLFPDSGDYHRFRRLSREMRRFAMVGSMLGSGPLSRPLLKVLIDDPVERQSHESFMVQLADLNAYAAYRRVIPDPQFPRHMWEELGSSIVAEANRYGQRPGEVDGIVLSR